MENPPKYYDIGELAEKLGVTATRIHQLVGDGRLVPVRPSRHYLFTEQAVANLLEIWPRATGGAGHLPKTATLT